MKKWILAGIRMLTLTPLGNKFIERFVAKIRRKEKIPEYQWRIADLVFKIYGPSGYLKNPRYLIGDGTCWLKDNVNIVLAGGTVLSWLVLAIILSSVAQERINVNETMIAWSWWPALIISLAITCRYYWRRVAKELEIIKRTYRRFNQEMAFTQRGIEPDFSDLTPEVWKKIDTPFWIGVRIFMKLSWIAVISLIATRLLIWIGIFY